MGLAACRTVFRSAEGTHLAGRHRLGQRGVLLGLHVTMSTFELGWCDDRSELRWPARWCASRCPGADPVARLAGPGELPRRCCCCAARRAGLGHRRALLRTAARCSTCGSCAAAAGRRSWCTCCPTGVSTRRSSRAGLRRRSTSCFHALADGGAVLIGGAPDGEDDLTRVTVIEARGLSRGFRAGGVCGIAAGKPSATWRPDRRGLAAAGQFDIGRRTALLARLERDGRCTVPFQPPTPTAVTDARRHAGRRRRAAADASALRLAAAALPARRRSISAMSRRCSSAPGAGLAVAERRPAAGRWLRPAGVSGDQSLRRWRCSTPAALAAGDPARREGAERRVATSGR